MNSIFTFWKGPDNLIDNSYFSTPYEQLTQFTNSGDKLVRKPFSILHAGSFMDQSSLCTYFKHCVIKTSNPQNIW